MGSKKQNQILQTTHLLQHWLCIIGDDNWAHLAHLGHPYYVPGRTARNLAHKMHVGDLCIVYRARSNKGFVGTFEITSNAVESPTRVGARTFPTRVPWRARLILADHAAELLPLVPLLEFITNKKSFGTYFQTNLRQLSPTDYATIECAMLREQGQ